MFQKLEPILEPVEDFQKQLRKKSGALGLWGCGAYLREMEIKLWRKRWLYQKLLKRLLLAGPQKGMHSVDIVKEITANALYFKKDVSFVDGKQVRSCANNNKDIFVCLPDNMIEIEVEEPTVIMKDNKYDI